MLGWSTPRLLDPNIWRPPWSKLENNHEHATKDEQPMSTPRRRHPQPTTQTLPTITKASKDQTIDTIPELQLQQINMPTVAEDTSQTGASASSTQTNRDDQAINNPPPPQVNQGKVNLDQIEIHDWDEANEYEAEAKEHELIRVQQEINRLRQEQELIMRRQAAAQQVQAQRQHINKERVRQAEL
jgi:hypothetical protein